jgi:hypothetical protein
VPSRPSDTSIAAAFYIILALGSESDHRCNISLFLYLYNSLYQLPVSESIVIYMGISVELYIVLALIM